MLLIRALLLGISLILSISFVFSFVATFMQVQSAILNKNSWQITISYKSLVPIVFLWVLFWLMGYIPSDWSIPQSIGGMRLY